jgi:cytochrome c oxidase subunit II
MRAEIIVQTPEEYQAWLTQEQEDVANNGIDRAIASNLLEPAHKHILNAQAQKMGIDSESLKSFSHHTPH